MKIFLIDSITRATITENYKLKKDVETGSEQFRYENTKCGNYSPSGFFHFFPGRVTCLAGIGRPERARNGNGIQGDGEWCTRRTKTAQLRTFYAVLRQSG